MPISKRLHVALFVILVFLFPFFGVGAELKVYMAQIKVRPGQFEATLQDIAHEYKKALSENADLMVLPEGILPGYPSNDNLFETDYIQRAELAAKTVQEMTVGKPTAILLGHIANNPSPRGRRLKNFVSVFENGARPFIQKQRSLF